MMAQTMKCIILVLVLLTAHMESSFFVSASPRLKGSRSKSDADGEWTNMKVEMVASEGKAMEYTDLASIAPPPRLSASIETFDIDLDAPPDKRWDHAVSKYRNETLSVFNWVVDRLVPKSMEQKIILAMDTIEKIWPHTLELKQEIDGIARSLGVAPGLVLALNLVYELSAACTSIVAQSSNGAIWHGRNLDFNIPNLQSITVNVRFVKNQPNQRGQSNKKVVLYEGTTYVGLVGLFTGMKPNAFSLSQDQRETDHGHLWENAIEWIFKGGQSSSFLYREVLQHAVDYQSAVSMLQQTPLIAPCYMIVGGTKEGEGAVISRDRNGPADTWTIQYDPADQNISTNSRWFLVETNDDHWLPPKDDRRDATNAHMKKVVASPENVSAMTLYNVLTMEPTFNELTTYTTIMSAETEYYFSVIQYPPPDPRHDQPKVNIPKFNVLSDLG